MKLLYAMIKKKFNKRIKSLIQDGILLFETFKKNRNNVEIITCLNNLNGSLALLINAIKQNYYSKIVEKLQNTQRSSKAYWSLLKIFLNNTKIPIIPPLYHKTEFLIGFQKKVELFNFFFADQCSLISNSSEIPSKLECLTQSRLSSINFSKDDIAKMIQNLDPNKAHGQDQTSIRMPKLCSTSICKPLEIIFNQYLEKGTFPNDWEKVMLFPSSKKMINEFSKTTVQSCYFLCVVKHLRNKYSRKFSNFSLKTIPFRPISLVLHPEIPV